MQWLWKVGYKKLVPDLTQRLMYWSDCQLVDIRPSGTYSAETGKHFLLIEDGRDFWEVRGSKDWKSTKPSVLEFNKYLHVADAKGRYPWDAGYDETTVPRRRRDWFLDYKTLLDSKLITSGQFDDIYNKSKAGILYIDRDITSLLSHEDSKTRLESVYSERTGTISANGAGSGTGGAFTIGAAGDYATITAFEADIAAQLTGNLTAEHLSEETAISTVVTFDTDTNTYLLKIMAASGAEHTGGAYGNGARINCSTSCYLDLDETTDGHLANVEISKLAFDCSGSGNRCVLISDGGNTLIWINRLLVKCDASTYTTFRVLDAAINTKITNCIVYGGSSNAIGFETRLNSSGRTLYLLNNTAVGNTYGFLQQQSSSSSTIVTKNNLGQDNTISDYGNAGAGWGTTGYNISEDTSSPNAAYRSKDLHTNTIFKDYASNDYRLDSAGDATNLAIVDDGENLYGSGVTEDIQGQARDNGTPFWIGASHIVAVVSGDILKQTYYYNMLRAS